MMKKILSIVSNTFLVIIVSIELLLIGISVYSNFNHTQINIFGYTVYYVATGSMEPEIKQGEVILSKIYTLDDELEIDDVITYTSTSGMSITHKIVDSYIKDGEKYVVTKGVANNISDEPIKLNQINAKFVTKLTFISFLYGILMSKVGFVMIVLIPFIALIVFEIKSIRKEIKNNEN